MGSIRRSLFPLVAGLALATSASAQTWPAKNVHVIVPFAPAGVTDIMGRLLAQKYSEGLGQQFIVDNQIGRAHV